MVQNNSGFNSRVDFSKYGLNQNQEGEVTRSLSQNSPIDPAIYTSQEYQINNQKLANIRTRRAEIYDELQRLNEEEQSIRRSQQMLVLQFQQPKAVEKINQDDKEKPNVPQQQIISRKTFSDKDQQNDLFINSTYKKLNTSFNNQQQRNNFQGPPVHNRIVIENPKTFVQMFGVDRSIKNLTEHILLPFFDLRELIMFSGLNQEFREMTQLGSSTCIYIWDLILPGIKLRAKNDEEADEIYEQATEQFSMFNAIEYVMENTIPNTTGWRETAKSAIGISRTEGVSIIEIKNVIEALSDSQIKEFLQSQRIQNFFNEAGIKMPEDKQDLDSELTQWEDHVKDEFIEFFK